MLTLLHHTAATLCRSGLLPGYAGQLDLLGCYLAATIHDYEHVGNTNDFLVNSHNKLALRYNDRWVRAGLGAFLC